ncbi:MAG: hypothetical protein RJA49_422 [Actinomycetota bacterium]
MDLTPLWRCTWRTGPDAGGSVVLDVGRHLVGRAARTAVHCDDPALEPHHLVLEVHPDGRLTATQLTGRVPVRLVDGAPIGRTTDLEPGATLELGGSTIECRPTDFEDDPPVTVRDDGTVVRRPRAVPVWQPAALTPPVEPDDHRQPPGGLVPALLGLVGAAVMALVLHQTMFLVFGAIGGLVAVASWIGQHVADRRRRARVRHDHEMAVAQHLAALAADRTAFVAAHVAATPTPTTVQTSLAHRTALWERRGAHGDAWRVSVGLGAVAWRTDGVHPVHVHDLPVPASLGPGDRIAVVGDGAARVAWSWLVQLAVECGPADVRFVVATEHPDRWTCLRGLPHLALPDGTDAIVAHDDIPGVFEQLGGDGLHVVLVTDGPDELATRTSAVRRVLAHGSPALIAVLPDGRGVPALCTAALTVHHGPTARWVADTATTLLPEPVRLTAMGERATRKCVRALAALRDPEDALAVGRLPPEVQFEELVGPLTAAEVLAKWSAAGDDPPPRTPVGLAADGWVDIDLGRDGPHGLFAGTTGAGKSELLRSLVAGLAVHTPPTHLQLVLVDYKGGATFDALTHLPHVVGVVTDLDGSLADRALRSLHAELRHREAVLRAHGAADLTALRASAPATRMPRLVVVVDEFAALVAEQPEFLHALVGVAQRGRSLGVHLLLATQRPQGVISDDIRANTSLRVALRLHDDADAVDVVGDRTPVTLPRRIPGRAVLRLGPDERVVFQTARVADPAALVHAVNEAAAASGVTAGDPPWQPPLPARLPRDEVPDHALGWCDDPDHQRRVPLEWAPSEGSVVVAGSPGCGVTSTLLTLAGRALAEPDTHVYVLTPHRDGAAAFSAHPAAAVVRLDERERLSRVLQRLRRPADDGARRVVVIDGLEAARRAVDDVDTVDEHDALAAVLQGVPGDTLLVGTSNPVTLPAAVTARCARRWVLHLHDPHDGSALGAAPGQVPPAVTGRVFIAERGLVAQLVEPGGPLPLAAGHSTLAPVTVTPEHVDPAVLPRGCATDDHLLLPLGLELATGQPWILAVPDGDHVLVLGGSRSGRSTALTRLTTAWREAHPDGTVTAVLPRRSLFPPHLADHVGAEWTTSAPPDGADAGPRLVVVDDAELFDDADGRLATLVSSRRSGLTVIAAARPDALRQRYGHWTSAVRHARLGLIAAGGSDSDGDLLGVALPRRVPVRTRPGLMWAAQDGEVRLLQLAVDAPARVTVDAGAK